MNEAMIQQDRRVQAESAVLTLQDQLTKMEQTFAKKADERDNQITELMHELEELKLQLEASESQNRFQVIAHS